MFLPPPSFRGCHVLADGAGDFSSTGLFRQHHRSLSLLLLIVEKIEKGSGTGCLTKVSTVQSVLFCSGRPAFNTSLEVSISPTSCQSVVESVVEELRSEAVHTRFPAIHRRRSRWVISGIPRRNIEKYFREVGALQGYVSTSLTLDGTVKKVEPL